MKLKTGKKIHFSIVGIFICATLLAGSLVLPGCTTEDTLHLDNELTAKAKKEKKEKERANAEARLMAQQAAKEKEIEKARQKLQDKVSESKLNPQELIFLELPGSFTKLNEQERHTPERLSLTDALLPECSTMWLKSKSGTLIMTGTVDTDAANVLQMTELEFKRELLTTGSQYRNFYLHNKDASESKLQIQKKGSVISLRVVSRYLENREMQIEYRVIYFYTPKYRLGLVVFGKESDLKKMMKQIKKDLTSFELQLSKLFPQGIKFQSVEVVPVLKKSVTPD